MPPNINRISAIALWISLLLALTWVFNGVFERQVNPNQSVQVVAQTDGEQAVVLKRNRAGHYLATGRINNYPVEFLVDTGATNISISAGLAQKIGLSRDAPLVARTANGNVVVYATTLAQVSLGPIRIDNVAANINPGLHGQQVLLGMSFLKHLKLVQQGDELVLSF